MHIACTGHYYAVYRMQWTGEKVMCGSGEEEE